MMNDKDICRILNDAEINRLMDAFLSFTGADRSTLPYRSLKNAVLLGGRINADNVLPALADIEARSEEEILSDISALTNGIDKAFNARFKSGLQKPLEMPHFTDPLDIIAFLGAAFMYAVESNYKK